MTVPNVSFFFHLWSSPLLVACSLQLRYDSIWSALVGRERGTVQEIELFEGEFIVQVRDFIGFPLNEYCIVICITLYASLCVKYIICLLIED